MTDPRDGSTVGLLIPEPGTIGLQQADAVPTRFGGFRTPEQPAALGPGEVAGRTLFTLLSPGTEMANVFAPADLSKAPPYPWIPGYAAAWQIDEVGAEVADLAVGDVVFSLGGHRSRQRERADQVWRLPEGLDPKAAVFARMMGIPMTTLTTTTARPGARVGVSGLGPVGHFAAVSFAAAGYDVTAWDPIAARRELLPDTVRVVDAAPAPVVEDQFGTTEGFDLVLECSGHDGAALAAVQTVRSRGEVVLVGTPWRRYTDATAHELLQQIFYRYAVVRSGWEWELPATPTPFVTGSASANIALALRWLASGRVAADGLADLRSPADAQEVYDSYAARTATHLSTVFDWTALGG
jgi:NADPH:quinone reductase-like Zn-dependent oxidoreductase